MDGTMSSERHVLNQYNSSRRWKSIDLNVITTDGNQRRVKGTEVDIHAKSPGPSARPVCKVCPSGRIVGPTRRRRARSGNIRYLVDYRDRDVPEIRANKTTTKASWEATTVTETSKRSRKDMPLSQLSGTSWLAKPLYGPY